jgi:homocysteine S-methyltransferase
VGPYGATLADGSEYRGRYGLGVGELTAWHRPRLEVLAEAGPDLLALETAPDADEAEALMAAISGVEIPAWPAGIAAIAAEVIDHSVAKADRTG